MAPTLAPRAVALWSRCLGLTACVDALSRVDEVRFLLSNDGWQRDPWWGTSLPAVSLLVAAEALLGWCVWRRWSATLCTIGLFVVVHVLQMRAAPGTSGGDTVLRLSLLWSALMGAERLRPVGRYIAFAYCWQLILMYCSSVVLKLQYASWRDGNAACLALQADDYTTVLAAPLLPWCSSWLMHWPVLVVEAAVPLVVAVCVWRRVAPRLVFWCVAAIAAMHVAFALTLAVWLFSWVSMLLWLPLLPISKVQWKWPRSKRVVVGVPRLVLVVAVVVVISIDVLSPLANGPRPAFAYPLGVSQRWGMFARDNWDVRWPVIEVLRADGSVVDPRRGGLPPTWALPGDLAATFNSVREHMLWHRAMPKAALVGRIARSYCAEPDAVAVRIVVVRRPMDAVSSRLRRVLFSRVVADVRCNNTSTTVWPKWATPPPRMTLRGRPAPLVSAPVDDDTHDDGDAP
jgi:hypothetical protein